jgi:hypothetical protein
MPHFFPSRILRVRMPPLLPDAGGTNDRLV